MPTQLLVERIPLPSLQKYVLFSFVGLASALFFGWSHSEDYMMEVLNSTKNITDIEKGLLYDTLTYTEYMQCFTLALMSHIWTVWVLVNMCYCLMALLAKAIQLTVFGSLRVSEVQQLKEGFWNFAFYKFIFIFGVLNVQFMNDAFMWTAWFSVICALQLFAQLSKLRFEYLSCSPATPKSQHVKLIFLLILILLLSFCMVAVAIVTALYSDWNIFGFMVAECLLLIIRTVYVILKYTIYLVDINHDGLWETRGSLSYYTDLVCELLVLVIDLLHYIHMVIWSNIFLSMASIVIWMQVRFLFIEIQKRVARHRNYLKVVRSMEARFCVASQEDIRLYDDNCAICWDRMQVARKLPCGHLFHNSCLRSWLAQDVSCPTCRVSLSEDKPDTESENVDQELEVPPVMNMDGDGNLVRRRNAGRPPRPDPRNMNRTTNFFHFDASRYISWLPSFSVEVTHMQMNNVANVAREPTQLDNMAREVQTVFPSIELTSIIEDLQNTHSVEITINNILEGRLVILGNTNPRDSDSSSESSGDTADSTPPLYDSNSSQESDDQEPAANTTIKNRYSGASEAEASRPAASSSMTPQQETDKNK